MADNVRSIQGEQQGELLPNRQVKVLEIGVSDTGALIERGANVNFSGYGTVIASYPKTFKGGTRNIIELAVEELELGKITPAEVDDELPFEGDGQG
jgi:hypothetical protein